MVICEKFNFTFLRIPKNASSSLSEFFIQNFCDKDDVFTEVNDCGIPNHNVPIDLIKKYIDKYRFIHLTLQELVDNNMVTLEQAETKRNICVMRNPYERQLSLYFFLKRGQNKSPEEFREIMKNGTYSTDPSNVILQTEYSVVNGKDLGEWWLYENLNDHLVEFVKGAGAWRQKQLEQRKGTYKPKDPRLLDLYYDSATKDAVQKYYEKDFEKYESLK
jgi:hypothetical protein